MGRLYISGLDSKLAVVTVAQTFLWFKGTLGHKDFTCKWTYFHCFSAVYHLPALVRYEEYNNHSNLHLVNGIKLSPARTPPQGIGNCCFNSLMTVLVLCVIEIRVSADPSWCHIGVTFDLNASPTSHYWSYTSRVRPDSRCTVPKLEGL